MKTSPSVPFCNLVVIFGCLFLVIAGSASPATAGDAVIDELIVTNSSKDVLLYFTVKNAFVPDMEKGVQNGIPATFTFFVELYRNRQGWMDQEVVSLSFTHTLTYDNLKDEYRVEFSEKNGRSVTTRSLPEAKKLMTEVNGFAVAPLDQLIPDKDYTLRVKARLEEKTLPLHVHYLIPFWSLWDFETDWHAVQFRY